MGRHIDHRGWCVNLIAIDREIFMTSSFRSDQAVIAHNDNSEQFPSINLNFSKYPALILEEWFEMVEDQDKMKRFCSANGHWENYFKAVLFRVMSFKPTHSLCGANYCVLGNIPIAAEVGSSSAITVAILESMNFWNRLNFSEEQLIRLSSEAEWFLGTRGGAGDHVAIKKCRNNMVSHVKFFDLEVLEMVPIPEEVDILMVDSNVMADKSSGKRD